MKFIATIILGLQTAGHFIVEHFRGFINSIQFNNYSVYS